MQPCVIIGRGHSGTRIPAWICHHLGIRLGADARVHSSGDCTDLAFKHHIRKAALTHIEGRGGVELSPEVLNRFQKAAHGFYQRLSPQRERWGWKYPETTMIAPYVATTFPKAKLIYILRDGRDSVFKAHYTDNPRQAPFHHNPTITPLRIFLAIRARFSKHSRSYTCPKPVRNEGITSQLDWPDTGQN